MHDRIDDISVPHRGTFTWALRDNAAAKSQGSSTRSGYSTSPHASFDHAQLIPVHKVEGVSSPSSKPKQIEGGDSLDTLGTEDSSSGPVYEVAEKGLHLLSPHDTRQLECVNVLPGWLQHGAGIFHIVGNPGSRKSTLMKFLCDHPRTRELLGEWAGGKKLVFAKSFFYRAGEKKQRTIPGLCRSLLHDILEEYPSLTSKALPQLWERIESTPWQVEVKSHLRSDHVLDALHRLFRDDSIHLTTQFALFIDGLDEHEDLNSDHTDMVKMLHSWVQSRPMA